jgi:hypothetical protein
MDAAVNCLAMDAMRNLVSGEFGVFHSKSAKPFEVVGGLGSRVDGQRYPGEET